MKRTILLSFFLFFVLHIFAQKDIKFKRISLEHGLSQSTVNVIFQDNAGFLWIGTEDGLNRYDGYNFVIYKNDKDNPHSISDNHIHAIVEDQNGNLLIGTSNGFNIFNKTTEKFTHYFSEPNNPNSLSNNYIQDIKIHNGYFWLVISQGGINRFDPKSKKVKRYMHQPTNKNSLGSDDIYFIHIQNDSVFWVGTTAVGLEKFNPLTGNFVHFKPDSTNINTVSSNYVWEIKPWKENMLWLATANGLDLYNYQRDTFIHYRHNPDVLSSISSSTVRRIEYDSKGNLWAGTDLGVNIFDDKTQNFINYRNSPYITSSIGDDHITDIYRDRQGKIWIGTYGGGVSMYNQTKEKFPHFPPNANDSNSVSHKYVWSLYEDKNGFLWIGTDKGLDKFDRVNNIFTNYQNDPKNKKSLSYNRVWAICGAEDGFLWVGTKEGLNKLNVQTGEFQRFMPNPNNPNSIKDKNIRRIIVDSDSTVWIGTWGEGLVEYKPKENVFYHHKVEEGNPKSISHNQVWAILEDSKGYIWTGGYYGGICRYDKKTKQFKNYKSNTNDAQSLGYDVVEAIHEDKYGNIWIGTWGMGIDKFDPKTEKFRHFTIKNGLPNGLIYGILEDNNENLWITTNNGMSKFDMKRETFENYYEADGLQSYEFNGGAIHKSSRTGEMFVGGIWGFNAFFPDSIKADSVVPRIVITGFKILNQDVAIGQKINKRIILTQPIYATREIELSYKEYMFSFEFAMLNFDNSEKVRYAYMLEGFDTEWRYTDEVRRFASYTNLDAGEYIFRVKGTNLDGIWNEGTELKITITPPFWETWWFRFSIILIICGLAYTYYRNRIKSIENQKIELERLVNVRTIELQESNAILVEKQEEILQQAEALKEVNDKLNHEKEYTMASIHYAQTIQSAILPIRSEFDEMFENFVIYLPKDIVSGDFYWVQQAVDEQSRRQFTYIAAVDCTGHGIPGAFMSLIGYNVLNSIVKESKMYLPSKILNKLNDKVVRALRQDKSDNDDGMDVCICRIEKMENNKYEIYFAGAVRPLFYFKKSENSIGYIKGDIWSVGGVKYRSANFEYKDSRMEMEKGDMLILTTDGLIDQNDLKRKRFSMKRFSEIILHSAHLPLSEQKENLLDELFRHQKDQPQRDDITVVAVRL